jgi:hypothetical protein
LVLFFFLPVTEEYNALNNLEHRWAAQGHSYIARIRFIEHKAEWGVPQSSKPIDMTTWGLILLPLFWGTKPFTVYQLTF